MAPARRAAASDGDGGAVGRTSPRAQPGRLPADADVAPGAPRFSRVTDATDAGGDDGGGGGRGPGTNTVAGRLTKVASVRGPRALGRVTPSPGVRGVGAGGGGGGGGGGGLAGRSSSHLSAASGAPSARAPSPRPWDAPTPGAGEGAAEGGGEGGGGDAGRDRPKAKRGLKLLQRIHMK